MLCKSCFKQGTAYCKDGESFLSQTAQARRVTWLPFVLTARKLRGFSCLQFLPIFLAFTNQALIIHKYLEVLNPPCSFRLLFLYTCCSLHMKHPFPFIQLALLPFKLHLNIIFPRNSSWTPTVTQTPVLCAPIMLITQYCNCWLTGLSLLIVGKQPQVGTAFYLTLSSEDVRQIRINGCLLNKHLEMLSLIRNQ